MARDHGRIFASIWTDEEFIALTPGPQRLYMFLLTQADLSHAGVIAMRERRWATRAKGLTGASLEDDLAALVAGRFVVADHDTEEVLVRTFIRNDGVWKQPNVMKAAVKEAREIMSPLLRSALAIEVQAIPVHELSDEVGRASRSPRDIVRDCIGTLLADLAGTLPGTPTETLPGTLPDTPPARVSPSTTTSTTTSTSTSAIAHATGDDESRPDVEALCEHLADQVEANGSKRPEITRRWRTSTRLLLDVDGRTPDQVRAAIDWCQHDEFWRSNILSMPKLREKYDQLRLAASRSQGRPGDRQIDNLRDAMAWAQQHDAQTEAAAPPAIGA